MLSTGWQAEHVAETLQRSSGSAGSHLTPGIIDSVTLNLIRIWVEPVVFRAVPLGAILRSSFDVEQRNSVSFGPRSNGNTPLRGQVASIANSVLCLPNSRASEQYQLPVGKLSACEDYEQAQSRPRRTTRPQSNR